MSIFENHPANFALGLHSILQGKEPGKYQGERVREILLVRADPTDTGQNNLAKFSIGIIIPPDIEDALAELREGKQVELENFKRAIEAKLRNAFSPTGKDIPNISGFSLNSNGGKFTVTRDSVVGRYFRGLAESQQLATTGAEKS